MTLGVIDWEGVDARLPAGWMLWSVGRLFGFTGKPDWDFEAYAAAPAPVSGHAVGRGRTLEEAVEDLVAKAQAR